MQKRQSHLVLGIATLTYWLWDKRPSYVHDNGRTWRVL